MFRIFGPPGTGKTTTLLNYVDQALAEGTSPREIAFLGFHPKGGKRSEGNAPLAVLTWTRTKIYLTSVRCTVCLTGCLAFETRT
jgi:superfamily I DNA/RNA helicase